MRYEVKIERDYLKVMVTPSDEIAGGAKELLYAVTEAVFKHGRNPILICGPHGGPLSLPDLYALARHVIDTPLRHCKIAFVYQADRELESSRFIDELGAERGLNLGVFPTEGDAIQWVTATQTNGQ